MANLSAEHLLGFSEYRRFVRIRRADAAAILDTINDVRGVIACAAPVLAAAAEQEGHAQWRAGFDPAWGRTIAAPRNGFHLT